MAHILARTAAARVLPRVAAPSLRGAALASRTLASTPSGGSESNNTVWLVGAGLITIAGLAGFTVGRPSIPKEDKAQPVAKAAAPSAPVKTSSGERTMTHATEARMLNVAKVFGIEADDVVTAIAGLATVLGVDPDKALQTNDLILAIADVLGVKHDGSIATAATGLAKLVGVDLDAKALAAAEQADAEATLVRSSLFKIKQIKFSHPGNLAIKHFDEEYFESLSKLDQLALLKIIKSGIDNPDSGMGCYAMQPADYDKFKPFFAKVLSEYHKVPVDAKHVNDWNLHGVKGLPEDGKLDLAKLGLPPLSMRVRVGRNLAEFPLPGGMTKDDRIRMEKKMCEAFDKLKAMPEYGGRYYSLTPGHPDHIDDAEYKSLVKRHIMFKDMAADPYLASAGIASDWPYGRGCYVSKDQQFVIWVGEEDHLRIMCMFKGTVLNDVFDRLKNALDVVNGIEGLKFATSPDYGYVTSCPTNLGTGMRASVHIPLPNLTKDGTEKQAKLICKPLGLSVRGTGGEHTPIGKDGTCDISPSARFLITEAQIITALYNGLKLLKEEEIKAGGDGEKSKM